METERITLSHRERDRLKVLHEVRQKHLSQVAAAERLKVTDRRVRRMLLRMPPMLCQGTLSCRNYGAIWIETQLLCVEHAAALNLKSLLNQKTPSQLGSLAASGLTGSVNTSAFIVGNASRTESSRENSCGPRALPHAARSKASSSNSVTPTTLPSYSLRDGSSIFDKSSLHFSRDLIR
jgi:hypothetical protein